MFPRPRRTRPLSFSLLPSQLSLLGLAFTTVLACAADSDFDPGLFPDDVSGKADGVGVFDILGNDFEVELDALPIQTEELSPLRVSRDLPDLAAAAALYDATFDTGDSMSTWWIDTAPTSDEVFRGGMFASAFEHEFRDDFATVNGVEWSADDLRAAYAMAWMQSTEAQRIVLGDGETEINPGVFHIVVTQLLARGQTVISGRSDRAGAVYTSIEVKGLAGDSGATGPLAIDRSRAESILRRDVDDADAYHLVFASIRTNTGFASESYILATDENGDIVGGYWTPSNSSFPALHPTRLWIATERPAAPADLSFDELDSVRDAFNGAIPGAIGDTYEFVGSPVAFTENKFFCAKVAMAIEDRFRVGDITVRADFSPASGQSWDHELQVRLFHAPPGNGHSLSRLAGAESSEPNHTDESGQWTTSDFHFDGSDSSSGPWELRVCDMRANSGDEDRVTGFVDSFSIEFHPID